MTYKHKDFENEIYIRTKILPGRDMWNSSSLIYPKKESDVPIFQFPKHSFEGWYLTISGDIAKS